MKSIPKSVRSEPQVCLIRMALPDSQREVKGTPKKVPLYFINPTAAIDAGSHSPVLSHPDGTRVFPQEIKERWAICIEPGETLSEVQWTNLLSWIGRKETALFTCQVERPLQGEDLVPYGWVTTRDLFKAPVQDSWKYFTSEIRLIPLSFWEELRLVRVSLATGTAWVIENTNPDRSVVESNIVISRLKKNEKNEPPPKRPSDRAIFLRGHEAFFSDRDLSPGFEWPHTVYHTLRLDHVPDVREALSQGLSNPDILHFTLVYLVRFRHFALARDLASMIPEVWLERHPGLAHSVATINYIAGNHQQALKLLRAALKRFPKEAWLAENAIKICILLGRFEVIDAIKTAYQKATGQKLPDDYLDQFETIHGKRPERTATVSLCLIIKDEARHLERAILSAKPVADEIIVVDTGSQDDSVTIARKHGAQVYHFPWNNDFSEARNFAIGKACSDYIFFLDGDEYISPFYYLESQALKKLLPLDPPCALKLAVGSYFNETDWLFLVGETGNFRIENAPVRIFPRQAGLVYSGIIGETVESSLHERGIPIRTIPDQVFHLIHDRTHKKKRIQRKIPLYELVADPDLPLLLQSVQDFSYLGLSTRTLSSLNTLFSRIPETGDSKRRIGLSLARLLEKEDPGQVEGFYRQLLALFPKDWPILKAYAEYLITNHRFPDLKIIPLDEAEVPTGNRTEKFNQIGFQSLKHFAQGEIEEAIGELTDWLEQDQRNLFGQSLRFYYLMHARDLEGALSSLEALFQGLGRPLVRRVDSLEQFLDLGETQAALLLEGNYLKERALVSAGLLTLGLA